MFMEKLFLKPKIITGYISNGKIFILDKEDAKKIVEIEENKQKNGQIPLRQVFELMELKKHVLPLDKFYNDKDALAEFGIPNVVTIVITTNVTYLEYVNTYLSPLVPGYYLLFQSEPTYEYSLRCANGKLILIICPTKDDTVFANLMKPKN